MKPTISASVTIYTYKEGAEGHKGLRSFRTALAARNYAQEKHPEAQAMAVEGALVIYVDSSGTTVCRVSSTRAMAVSF